MFNRAIEGGGLRGRDLAALYVERGWNHARSGSADRALADFERAIELDPQFAEAFNGRGWARQLRGDLEAALEDFDAALAMGPAYAMAHNNRGVTLDKAGRPGPARQSFDQAIRIGNDPEAAGFACFNRGWLSYVEGRLDDALEDFNRGLAHLPNDAMAYNNRGVVFDDRGEREKAFADYRRAIELNNNPEATAYASLNLGVSLMLSRENDAACDAFRMVINHNLPKKPYASIWLFLAAGRSGKDAGDVLSAEITGRADGEEWPVPACEMLLGRIPIRECLDAAWHRNPLTRKHQRAEALFYAAEHCLRQGLKKEARAYFQECLRCDFRESNQHRCAKAELANLKR